MMESLLILLPEILFCRIRVPYPFQWGAPTFDAGEAFAMMAASFVALVEACFIFFLRYIYIYIIYFVLLTTNG